MQTGCLTILFTLNYRVFLSTVTNKSFLTYTTVHSLTQLTRVKNKYYLIQMNQICIKYIQIVQDCAPQCLL